MARPTTKLKSIEAAALKLFATKGLGQVTIKDIAREAGCTEGALYRHYTSKDEMAWALFTREVEKFGAKLREVVQGPGTFAKRVRKGVAVFYRFFDEDTTAFSFVLLSQHNFPRGRELNPDLNPNNLVIRFIEEGVKKGKFGIRDAALGAAMVRGLVLQPAIMHATGRFKYPMSAKVDDVSDACLKVLQTKEG